MQNLWTTFCRGLGELGLVAAFVLLGASLGCQKAADKPTDPAELERIRQQQQQQSQREWENKP